MHRRISRPFCIRDQSVICLLKSMENVRPFRHSVNTAKAHTVFPLLVTKTSRTSPGPQKHISRTVSQQCLNIETNSSCQPYNHTNTSSLIFVGQMLFLMPNQQCQSTEGNTENCFISKNHYLLEFSLTVTLVKMLSTINLPA